MAHYVDGLTTPFVSSLYIRRPIEDVRLFTHIQRKIGKVLGDRSVFRPRPVPSATVSLLRQRELERAMSRSRALQQIDESTVRQKVREALPESSKSSVPVEPAGITVIQAFKRHLVVELEPSEVDDERATIIDTIASLGDIALGWQRGPAHISFGTFERAVSPRTLELMEGALDANLPDTFTLRKVTDKPFHAAQEWQRFADQV